MAQDPKDQVLRQHRGDLFTSGDRSWRIRVKDKRDRGWERRGQEQEREERDMVVRGKTKDCLRIERGQMLLLGKWQFIKIKKESPC